MSTSDKKDNNRERRRRNAGRRKRKKGNIESPSREVAVEGSTIAEITIAADNTVGADIPVGGDLLVASVIASGPKRHRLILPAVVLLVFVVLPFTVVALYLSFVASDRYVSEAHFTIRDSSGAVDPGGLDITSLLSGGGGATSQDAYLISDYILSPDLLGRLDEALGLRAAWSDPNIDPVWRLAEDASDEDFLEYYRGMVEVDYDTETTIITTALQGFTPDTTQTMLLMILTKSEKLVNEISNRLARDQLSFINSGIDQNMVRLKESKSRLLAFQNENDVMDPQSQAGLITNVIAQMEVSLAEDRAELKALGSYLDRNAPELVILRSRINAKAQQIEAEKTRLTGGDKRLNSVMARFEELRFDVEFASERYRLALLALEAAQVDASKKVKSLVVISQPYLPDEALYPERTYILVTLGVFLLMGFGVLSVITAAIREHME